MNIIEAFGIIDNFCEKVFDGKIWKIKSYDTKDETVTADVVVILKQDISSIDVEYNIEK